MPVIPSARLYKRPLFVPVTRIRPSAPRISTVFPLKETWAPASVMRATDTRLWEADGTCAAFWSVIGTDDCGKARDARSDSSLAELRDFLAADALDRLAGGLRVLTGRGGGRV
ncbi:hypothetical protein NUW54_g14103 [Trametes sanguinea]|uniref:Uncharacterized protein n=1 Tax=Trametes sanguinea TaxID=158606 RepID=A0ACC1MFM3_9APHY|nr:hypothetical protein NUW54_g14103 [Trametes sanguinea]